MPIRRGTPFVLEVNATLPPELSRLTDLADNLWYSWDRPTRELFARLHPGLWDTLGHSPKAFLRNIDEQRLVVAAQDAGFMHSYRRVLEAYDNYHADAAFRNRPDSWREGDLVAYFCAEFGFHESLPIYSGGLGILAGDHCKAASDMRLPFVGVGLLYRQGYFAQTIDANGSQIDTYADSDFATLPVTRVRNGTGDELRVSVDLPGRSVSLRLWNARVGHVNLYFLDADVPQNSSQDRRITHRLYGGDRTVRLEQEIVLGIGGARALAALGIRPSVWHINEGHAAFLILERVRDLVAQGINIDTAFEAVAADVVFTTHTAVPAGHDRFDMGQMQEYFRDYCRELGIDGAKIWALGRVTDDAGFDMTALAVRGSRFHCGVSRLHGQVTSRMLQNLWPQIPADENPIDYVTNGVYAPTYLAPEWGPTFERVLGTGWKEYSQQGNFLERILELPDETFWSIHQNLKAQMLHLVRHRISVQHYRNQGSESQLERRLRHANPDDPNVLTIGFARRFATYKRAELLFNDLERLRHIASQAGRPIVFIFAGKAHPADIPGQEIIRHIARIARHAEWEDKILLVEGYDIHLARRLVSGVDVWLNNPIYRLEASGTSGMKAGMNGVLNLSVLDGWWAEGFERGNGWGIKPAAQGADQETRDREDARALYDILETEVIPLYYDKGQGGYSSGWARMAKQSIAMMLPRFNATRMLSDYVRKFYGPAARQGERLNGTQQYVGAATLAEWKARVHNAWPRVTITRVDEATRRFAYGASVRVEVAVQLAGLAAGDVTVELLLERAQEIDGAIDRQTAQFQPSGPVAADGAQRYILDLAPEFCGRLDYFIRAYPYHELLTQRFELGLMLWV